MPLEAASLEGRSNEVLFNRQLLALAKTLKVFVQCLTKVLRSRVGCLPYRVPLLLVLPFQLLSEWPLWNWNGTLGPSQFACSVHCTDIMHFISLVNSRGCQWTRKKSLPDLAPDAWCAEMGR